MINFNFLKIHWRRNEISFYFSALDKPNIMSENNSDHYDTKRFTLNVLIGFITVFLFLMLMMQCHGDFKPGAENKNSESTETVVAH